MTAVLFILWTIVLFGVLHNAWAISNVVWSLRWISTKRESGIAETSSANFVIFLPMFQEKRMARTAITHFSNLDYPTEKYQVVVVTTQREKTVGGDNTTLVVREVLSELELENFHLFEADGNDVCKADQLNQTLDWLNRTSPTWWEHNVIVGVYDADSRPEYTSLLDVAEIEDKNSSVNLFQQPSLYLTNFYEMPRGVWKSLLQSRPLYNLRFCLYREMPGFFRSVLCQKLKGRLFSFIARSPNHFLGHGEFIRRQTLEGIGGFPPPSGDTSLGTVLSFKGEAIYPLRTFDLSESPNEIGMLAFQGANWYAGCALYTRDLQLALAAGSELSAAHLLMCFKRWLENMIWCLGPIVWLVSLFFAIVTGQALLLFFCVAIFILHGVSLVLIAHGAAQILQSVDVEALGKKPRFHELLRVIPSYSLMLFIACSGPCLYYWYRIQALSKGGVLPRWKTNRDDAF